MSVDDLASTPLHRLIIDRIRATGALTIGEYMELCLSDPQHGYYVGRDPLGRSGDFITAPEVSQMFGELVGVWALACWRELRLAGPPRLIELGAGRGTLMADACRAIMRLAGERSEIDIDIVEISPALRRKQEQALKAPGLRPRWSDCLAEVAPGPFILIANEFLDCLPIRQWQASGGRWLERKISADEAGRLVMTLADAGGMPGLPDAVPADAEDGLVIEHSQAAHDVMRAMALRLHDDPGAALFIDYGPPRSGYGDTLQAMKGHAFVDPLSQPGEVDLTAHVDFAALAATARAAGMKIGGPVTQAAFLRALGIIERAARLADGKPEGTRQVISEEMSRLISPQQMGELFKVLAVSTAELTLPPFEPAGDRS